VKQTNGDDGEEIEVRRHELFSASYDGTIMHWDLEKFEPFQGGAGGPWKGHVRGINDLCLTVEEDSDRAEDAQGDDHGKEFLYSAGSDGTIRKWDITRGQGRGGHCVHVFNHHATTVYRVIVEAVEIWSSKLSKNKGTALKGLDPSENLRDDDRSCGGKYPECLFFFYSTSFFFFFFFFLIRLYKHRLTRQHKDLTWR